MNQQKQIEAAARLEGFDLSRSNTVVGYKRYPKGKNWEPLPDYLHDHNDIQQLVDRMSVIEMERYVDFLRSGDGDYSECEIFFTEVFYIIQATCEQKLEAILRAYGVWEES